MVDASTYLEWSNVESIHIYGDNWMLYVISYYSYESVFDFLCASALRLCMDETYTRLQVLMNHTLHESVKFTSPHSGYEYKYQVFPL